MNRSHSRSRLFLILMLGALCTVSPFSIDMYLPAFPGLAHDLNTTVGKIGLSVSSYFVGLAFGQIFYGPLLDRFGRKPPLCAGLLLYIAASLGCVLSSNIDALITFRFFQALGGCAASVASTAMVRDFFPARESAKIFSLLMLILGVSPLLAPSVGSFVVVWLGWKAVFILLALIVSAILAVTFFFLPEGHAPDHDVTLRPLPIFRIFKSVLREPQFFTYTIAGSLSFSGLFAYVAGSPAVFMGYYHLSAEVYGGIFAFLAVGFIGGSQINLLLVRRYSNAQIFDWVSLVQCLVGIVMLAGTWFGVFGLTSTLISLFAFLLCTGIGGPNASAIALAPFSKSAGSAAALLGFLQMGIGALASTGVGLFNIPGSLPTIATMVGGALFGWGFLRFGKTRLAAIVMAEDDAVMLHPG